MSGDILVTVQQGRDWLDYLSVFATAGGFVVVGIYTFFTYRQLKRTTEAVRQAETSNVLAERALAINEKLLEQAREDNAKALARTIESNEHTAESNQIAREALELGKRAWLVVRLKPTDILETIEISNLGEVPATDVEVWYRFDLFETGEIPERIAPRSDQISATGIVLGAGMSYRLVPQWRENRKLSDEETQKNKDGMASYIFYCEVKYLDIFRKPRRTVACYRYSPRLSVGEWEEWGYAPRHNRLE